VLYTVIAKIRIANPDPGSGAFLTPGSGMGKKSGFGSGMGKQSGSGSGMNNPVHISYISETVFWVKILKILVDEKNSVPGSGMEKSRIWDKHPESATLAKMMIKDVNG
jgi:hypothetical protein